MPTHHRIQHQELQYVGWQAYDFMRVPRLMNSASISKKPTSCGRRFVEDFDVRRCDKRTYENLTNPSPGSLMLAAPHDVSTAVTSISADNEMPRLERSRSAPSVIARKQMLRRVAMDKVLWLPPPAMRVWEDRSLNLLLL